MPTKLSKFCIAATCKEYTHHWSDSCIVPNVVLGLHCVQECLKIYTPVYLVTLLMKGKIPTTDDLKKTLLGILQSSAFLSWSGFSYSLFICILRHLLGHFNVLTVSFLPSFLSSLSAIYIERPSRRPLLSLYVSNVATETLFRMGVWRGYFSAIPKGEVYIFGASMALLLYFFRARTNKKDSIYKLIRFIIGQNEETEYIEKNYSPECRLDSVNDDRDTNNEKVPHKQRLNILLRSFEAYKQIIRRLKAQSKHISCPHPHSCAHYVLTGSAKLFSIGVIAQLTLTLALGFKKFLKKPELLKASLLNKKTTNLALFLGGFSGLYKLASCLLRRALGKDSNYYAIPAGFLGSIAFMAFPNNTIALYFMWKALQVLWNDLQENGIVPEVKWFMIFLYCFSTSVLFHAAIIEPQNLRSSYWKFLYNLSGGRIATMSRKVVDLFGFESGKHLQDVLRKTGTTDQLVFKY